MWDYRAALVKPHDGDTFRVLADTGFAGRQEVDVRLLDVHAPELGEPGGTETARFVNTWLTHAATVQPGCRWPLYVLTSTTGTAEPGQRRTFTRYLAQVWRFDQRPDSDRPGPSLNDTLRRFLADHPQWGPGE